ncbi:MAG: dihydrolipoyl dehydrogenase [Planctomycetota bacterium]|jgi:dihydrolipoamide dehydrogenase
MVVGEFTQETKLLVIGGGPGGYTAAFRAADLGIATMVVDPRPTLGGVCLYEGCVPSKTLLSVAETLRNAQRADRFGVHFGQPRLDFDQLREWVQQTVSTLGKGLASQQRRHGVERVEGMAHLEDDQHAVVPGARVSRIKFRRVIVATGSAPIEHHALPFDGERVLRPAEAMSLRTLPKRLLVVGSGYMTVEMASIYAALGSRVSLISPGDSLVPGADADLLRPLQRGLRDTLRHVGTGTDVASADFRDDGVHVTFSGSRAPDTSTFDAVIVSIGQRPTMDGLGLERLDVACDDNGFIVVDEQLRTSNPRIMAVGDLTGPPLLADKAIHQGRVAAEVVAGWGAAFDARVIPMVVFTDPQIAWCGLTESEAADDDVQVEVRKIPWGASGRATGMGRSDGLTKIIYEPDTKIILGLGIVGPGACEMIAEGCLAIEMGAELSDLSQTIHPHPTMSELVSDVARSAEQES